MRRDGRLSVYHDDAVHAVGWVLLLQGGGGVGPILQTALTDEIAGEVGARAGADGGEDGVEAGHVEGFGAVPVLGPVGESGNLAVREVEVVGVDDG